MALRAANARRCTGCGRELQYNEQWQTCIGCQKGYTRVCAEKGCEVKIQDQNKSGYCKQHFSTRAAANVNRNKPYRPPKSEDVRDAKRFGPEA